MSCVHQSFSCDKCVARQYAPSKTTNNSRPVGTQSFLDDRLLVISTHDILIASADVTNIFHSFNEVIVDGQLVHQTRLDDVDIWHILIVHRQSAPVSHFGYCMPFVGLSHQLFEMKNHQHRIDIGALGHIQVVFEGTSPAQLRQQTISDDYCR